jgi:hypothetical protein
MIMLKYLLPVFFCSVPVWSCALIAAAPHVARASMLARMAQPNGQLGGQTIAEIIGKDLVHPTLSPDGKFLAYSEVIVENKRENTAVRILNLSTNQTFLLISPQVAAEYKTYGSYVSAMYWNRTNRLEVTISDGDVGSTILTFEPFQKKLLSVRYEESLEFSTADEKLRKRIRAQFPKVQPEELSPALLHHKRLETSSTVVLEGKLLNKEKNLWLLDFQKRSIKSLFKATDPLAQARIASSKVASDGTFLLILETNDDQQFLVIYQNGQITKRQLLSGMKGRPKILHTAGNKIWIISYVYNTYEEGHNPLYLWDNGDLRQSTDYDRLYDVHVNRTGTRIAYCYWIDGKRRITVKELI